MKNCQVQQKIISVILITSLFVIKSGYTFSQSASKLDSLYQELAKAKEDTNKVNIYIELCNLHRLTRKANYLTADSLINLASEGLLLAQELNSYYKVAKLCQLIGAAKVYNQEYDTSFYFFNKALEILKVHKDSKLESLVCLYAGVCKLETGDYGIALEWFNKGLKLAYIADNKSLIYNHLHSSGISYKNLDEFDKALHYYLESLKVAEEIGDSLLIGRELKSVAIIYSYKNNDKALEYYDRALKYIEKSDYKLTLASILINIGSIYDEKNKTEKSITYCERGLEIYKEYNRSDYVATTQNKLVTYYSKLGFYENAYKTLIDNYQYFKETGAKPHLISTLNYLGDFHMNEGKYYKAIEFYKERLKLSNQLGKKYIFVWTYKDISKSYEGLKDYEKALEYYKLYHNMSDSLFNENTAKQINEMEVKYETEKKQQRIELQESKLAQQEAEIEQQKTLKRALFGGLVALMLVIIVVSYAYVIKRKANNKIKKQKNEIEQQSEHLKESNVILQQQALSAQINPHFIFNTLNSIQCFIYENNKEASNKYLSRFSKLMRLTLDNSQHQTIPLEKELEALELYLDLELLRFENKFEYNINCAEDILDYKIPTLLIQPFVENAILHGIANKKDGKGKVEIDIKVEDKTLYCVVDDNGIGREAARKIRRKKNISYKSLGTKITEKRLDVANTLYNRKIQIEYIDKYNDEGNSSGTRVEIYIPFMV